MNRHLRPCFLHGFGQHPVPAGEGFAGEGVEFITCNRSIAESGFGNFMIIVEIQIGYLIEFCNRTILPLHVFSEFRR